jgi:hypothetical protein
MGGIAANRASVVRNVSGFMLRRFPLVTSPARAGVRANIARTGLRERGAGRRLQSAGRPMGPGRLAMVLVVAPVVGGLTIGTAIAQRPPPVASLASDEAADQGATISIVAHPDLAPGLAEVLVPAPTGDAATAGTNRLLALAPSGDQAAVAQQVGPNPTTLVLARSDHSQLQVQLPGLIAAGFAPDGTWLAVVDGTGALWRVQADTGAATRLAYGPFIGRPTVEAAGTILTLRVSSVEAPFVSRLARVAADGSPVTILTDDELVYGAQPLADGSLAFVAQQASSTQVWRLSGGLRQQLADLGQDAVNVAVAPAGDTVAWESGGQVYLRRLPAGRATPLASGERPQFAGDGRSLLVEQPGGSTLIGIDGDTIAAFASQAGFATCAEGCGS